ncbi:RNA-directed DNA polymerase from mobile element jockey-like Protein [Tribolium castaneum]|uniref:RNA-directed DNA polymerase from mobile element jockey-like Protein n=1 Tax=Tribolium castaneum TaxID=7070 RepID=D7EHZ1_TRICA|nr:RNA-directed DNA polymerase from mobile element jockey-like Protein [Tribolium castaneum]
MSTTVAVKSLCDVVLSAFEDKDYASITCFDLTKAFDCVNHDILLNKLQYYALNNNSLLLLKSYLSNRKQFVYLNGYTSALTDIVNGVPQGSVFGPLLFLIFINDLPHAYSNGHTVLFAGDSTAINRSSDLTSLSLADKVAHESVSDWISSNKLVINTDKTQTVLCSLKPLKNRAKVKLLGIIIDSKMTWDSHVDIYFT